MGVSHSRQLAILIHLLPYLFCLLLSLRTYLLDSFIPSLLIYLLTYVFLLTYLPLYLLIFHFLHTSLLTNLYIYSFT